MGNRCVQLIAASMADDGKDHDWIEMVLAHHGFLVRVADALAYRAVHPKACRCGPCRAVDVGPMVGTVRRAKPPVQLVLI